MQDIQCQLTVSRGQFLADKRPLKKLTNFGFFFATLHFSTRSIKWTYLEEILAKFAYPRPLGRVRARAKESCIQLFYNMFDFCLCLLLSNLVDGLNVVCKIPLLAFDMCWISRINYYITYYKLSYLLYTRFICSRAHST